MIIVVVVIIIIYLYASRPQHCFHAVICLATALAVLHTFHLTLSVSASSVVLQVVQGLPTALSSSGRDPNNTIQSLYLSLLSIWFIQFQRGLLISLRILLPCHFDDFPLFIRASNLILRILLKHLDHLVPFPRPWPFSTFCTNLRVLT